jgi:hypothetical protein
LDWIPDSCLTANGKSKTKAQEKNHSVKDEFGAIKAGSLFLHDELKVGSEYEPSQREHLLQ